MMSKGFRIAATSGEKWENLTWGQGDGQEVQQKQLKALVI